MRVAAFLVVAMLVEAGFVVGWDFVPGGGPGVPGLGGGVVVDGVFVGVESVVAVIANEHEIVDVGFALGAARCLGALRTNSVSERSERLGRSRRLGL